MRKAVAVVTSVPLVISLFFTIPANAAAPIDYHYWKLQQPDGLAISSSQLLAGYHSVYFYRTGRGQAFMDTKTGTVTTHSEHPRTELIEQLRGSDTAWDWTGTNSMTNRAAVTLQGGPNGSTTIGQIFNNDNSIPLVELEYEAEPNSAGGNFTVLYEECKGHGTYTKSSMKIALRSQFTYALSLSHGVATVSINGVQIFSHKPSTSLKGKNFYFKCGDYDQTATQGPVITVPYTIVELYNVTLLHDPPASGSR